jgi:hypothetical protein
MLMPHYVPCRAVRPHKECAVQAAMLRLNPYQRREATVPADVLPYCYQDPETGTQVAPCASVFYALLH